MPTSKVKTSRQLSSESQNTKFEEIQRRNLEVLRKRLQSYKVSDDEEDDDIETDKSKVDALFHNYQGNESDVARIRQFFESGENIDCLICIRQVKAKEQIWSCMNCFCTFHLICIQKWANENLVRKQIFYDNQPAGYYTNSGVFVSKKEVKLSWDCPQCRKSYEPNEIPRHYECFCKKEREPVSQPFLIPHSCGDVCNHPLEPLCGHRCLILCHPGPHPQCAQVIHTSCECKKSEVKAIRCSQRSWSCDKKCTKLLSCGVHKCEGICHAKCPPCTKTRVKKCSCGNQSKDIECIKPSWNCQKVCKKLFPCKLHQCERTCHEGDCGNCLYGLERTCFCGKQAFTAESCEESLIESCGDTCLKPLSCGSPNHYCLQRCHKEECSPCDELVEKICRCGSTTKKFPCSKDLLCEAKCKLLKNCKKHSCNRKCCVECPPCSNLCGKQLSCGNTKHKCNALCHDGSCYPCNVKQKIKCRCGSTSMSVLCGRGKKGRSPKCAETCKLPSKCHHDPLHHNCHYGECSKCVQICDELLLCLHLCKEKCHDHVKVITKDKNFVPKFPGEMAEEKIEFKKLPHPPCNTKIPVVCLGGHETTMMKCHEARRESCGRDCERKLKCGNHFCKKSCHAVADDQKSAEQDENCLDCNSPCTLEKHSGCTHACPKQCHPSPCKKCVMQIKTKCFCGLTDVYYRCCDVNKKGITDNNREELKRKYLNCGSRCIKTYICGHQCKQICHSGTCNVGDCQKKVKLTCACKTRKVEYTCEKIREENITLIECDDLCQAKRQLVDEQRKLDDARMMEMEAEKNRRELELFEKKFGKKVHKERKQKFVVEKKSNQNLIMSAVAVSALLIACSLYFTIFK